ncbi:MAG: MFS transporter [Chloroflexi bacterium]|jgi:MFS family permease|nr:MFS transporter [Chloroflexota bacterium]MBT5627426.1 MFS transporter [Chloroflexota bacterium]
MPSTASPDNDAPNQESSVPATRKSLWKNPDFLKIWTSQSTSNLGRMMMVVPLVAILILEARPYQMAILGAATTTAGLAFGLFAGPWIDRSRRRIVLIITDFGSAATLASVAIAHFLFELHIEHLYVVAFLNGSFGIFNEVAQRSYLPSLIEKDRLLEANSKMAASDSVVEQIGFSVGGFIAQLASAIAASIVQTITFLISGLLVLAIRKPEPKPETPEQRPNIRREILDGYRFILGNPTLKLITISGVLLGAANGIIGGMITLFAISEIGIQPGPLGIIYGIGGVSSFFGALYAARVTNKLGVGPTMALGLFSYGVVGFLIPLAPNTVWIAMIFFIMPQIFGDGFWVMHDINKTSLQQAIIPTNYLGRVIGAMKVSEKVAALIGVSIAGVVAEIFGLRVALAGGSVIWLMAGAIYLHPTIRSIKTIPVSTPTENQ